MEIYMAVDIEELEYVAEGRRSKGRAVKEGEEWVNVRISADMKARIETWGADIGRSMSYILRRLAEEALEAGRDERGERL